MLVILPMIGTTLFGASSRSLARWTAAPQVATLRAMILKEPPEIRHGDKFGEAGDKAERQMAFYLKQAFGHDETVQVLNNIRLERDDGIASQVDHLIVHRWGFVVIESKSVHDAIEVNEHGEFSRWHAGRPHGMQSPVEQAKRQIEFFKQYLNDHAEEILGKVLGMQKRFGGRTWDHLVAISDTGRIHMKPASVKRPPTLCKAEQVVGRIRELFEQYAPLLQSDPHPKFSRDELGKIAAFLLEHDRPFGSPKREATVVEAAISPVATMTEGKKPLPAGVFSLMDPGAVGFFKMTAKGGNMKAAGPSCGKCGSGSVSVEFGNTYYLKCGDCGANTPIKPSCPTCGGKEKISKRGREYTAACNACGTARHYYTNPA